MQNRSEHAKLFMFDFIFICQNDCNCNIRMYAANVDCVVPVRQVPIGIDNLLRVVATCCACVYA